MQQVSLILSLLLAGLFTTLVSCDSGQSTAPAAKTVTAETAPNNGTALNKPEADALPPITPLSRTDNAVGVSPYKQSQAETTPVFDGARMAAVNSPGRTDNDEGVGHYKQGHLEVASDWFRKAIMADPRLAEAHYNLAITLDKMGKHDEAIPSFKASAALAQGDHAISD